MHLDTRLLLMLPLAALVHAAACGGDGGASEGVPERGRDGGGGGGEGDSSTSGDQLDPTLPCSPGDVLCDGRAGRIECNEGGDSWRPVAGCEGDQVCSRGECVSACSVAGKFDGSNVACEFWSTDLGQWHVREGEMGLDPSVSTVPHAVVIGNPGDQPAEISFEVGDGTPVAVSDPIVPPHSARAFTMPVLSLQESGVSRQSIRVTSSEPVAATQHNPGTNEQSRHSTDSSLLLPVGMLGREYFAITQGGIIGMTSLLGKSPDVLGYFVVVAAEPGVTQVDVTLAADTAPGPEFPAYSAGETIHFTLQQFDVLTLNGRPTDTFRITGDLTGSRVVSSRNVAVFTGHQCFIVGGGNCDHLEAQLLPVESWGTEYVAGSFDTPNQQHQYRVSAAVDGTAISTDPPIAGLDGAVLDRGEWVEVVTEQHFVVRGTLPVQVAQFMAGNNEEEGEYAAYLIDTSMTVLVPTSRYHEAYALLVPAAYAQDRLMIARPSGVEVRINAAPVDEAVFRAVGGSGWEVGIVEVDDGVVVVESEAPCGVVQYGFDMKVSYANPGGIGMGE